MLFSGCTHYDYGVYKEHPQLQPHPALYQGWGKGGYEFFSTICTDPHINIYHAAWGLRHGEDHLRSSLEIGGSFGTKGAMILSVILEHRDGSGRTITPVKKEWDALPTKAHSAEFHNLYNTPFPSKVTEVIKIEIQQNGETKFLEYSFPLELKKSGSGWDVIMGI